MATYDGDRAAGGFTNVPGGMYRVIPFRVETTFRKRQDGSHFALGRLQITEVVGSQANQELLGEMISFTMEHPFAKLPIHQETGGKLIGYQYPRSPWWFWLTKFDLSPEGLPMGNDKRMLEIIDAAMGSVGAENPVLIRVNEDGWPHYHQAPDEGPVLAVFAGFQHVDYDSIPPVPTWSVERSQYTDKDGRPKYNRQTPPLFRIIHGPFTNTLIPIRFLNYTLRAEMDEEAGEWVVLGGGERANFPRICSGLLGVGLREVIESHSAEIDAMCEALSGGEKVVLPNLLPFIQATALDLASQGHIVKLELHDEKHYVLAARSSVASRADFSRLAGGDVVIPPLKTVGEWLEDFEGPSAKPSVERSTTRALADAINTAAGLEALDERGSLTADGILFAKRSLGPLYKTSVGDGFFPVSSSDVLAVPVEMVGKVIAVLESPEYSAAISERTPTEAGYTLLDSDLRNLIVGILEAMPVAAEEVPEEEVDYGF